MSPCDGRRSGRLRSTTPLGDSSAGGAEGHGQAALLAVGVCVAERQLNGGLVAPAQQAAEARRSC